MSALPLIGANKIVHKFIIYDKYGRVKRRGEVISNSWTENYTRLQKILFVHQTVQLYDKDGSGQPVYTDYLDDINVKAPEGSDTYGIIVGDSTQTDINTKIRWLASQIPHSDTGLYYYDTLVETTIHEGSSPNERYFIIRRDFKNMGTASIYVREVGLAILIGTLGPFLLVYDTTLSAKGVETNYVEIRSGETLRWMIMPKTIT